MGAGSVADTIKGPLEQLTSNSSTGLALIIGIAGALWSASGYVGAFGRAMNRIYEIREGRPFWKLRPLMIVITLAAVILAGLVAIGLVVSGPLARAIGDAIGLGDTAVTVWSIVKWPVLLGLAALAVAILYYATPNIHNRSSGGSAWAPPSRSSPGSSPRPCSACTFPSSPTTTRPTDPSPE